MLSFCGHDLNLIVDQVLHRDYDRPVICSAIDSFGAQRWLVLEIDSRIDHLAWLCVPTTTRAIDLVATGRTLTGDVARHSSTGWVQLITADHGRSMPDRCILCSQLSLPTRPHHRRRAMSGTLPLTPDHLASPVHGHDRPGAFMPGRCGPSAIPEPASN